jgi:transcriptional regulator GlxA family with amidase domain
MSADVTLGEKMQVTASSSTQPQPVSWPACTLHERAEARAKGADAASLVVRTAEALILSQPDAHHTLESLARAAGVSTRSLCRAFQHCRGYGPIAAVRSARLSLVRHDLLAGRSDDSVTDAAMRWGFSHLGRFSRIYARQFGELPSDTRRRSRTGRSGPARAVAAGDGR